MKTAGFLLVLLLLVALLLPGCGKKELDAETVALAEACDAVCHVRPLAERYQPSTQFPDEPYKRLAAASRDKPFRLLTPVIGEPVFLDETDRAFPRWWEEPTPSPRPTPQPQEESP